MQGGNNTMITKTIMKSNRNLKDGMNIYSQALREEAFTAYELADQPEDEQLNFLKRQIEIRIKITANEIFKIGELLCLAKHVCLQQKIGFQEWIDENFDFSYETAKNFMNVHNQCMGYRELAVRLPFSILYRISAPGFPDELRDYLITNGNLEKISNNHFKQILQKYRDGGFEAIEQDVEKIKRRNCMNLQMEFTLDIYHHARQILDGLSKKIYLRDTTKEESEAREIGNVLQRAIEDASNVLSEAFKKSEEMLEQSFSNAKDEVQ